MATIDNKSFIDNIIANNGWHSSTFENEADKEEPDNPRVHSITEYTNASGIVTWGVTFVIDRDTDRYLLETEYVNNPKVIWKASDHPLETP